MTDRAPTSEPVAMNSSQQAMQSPRSISPTSGPTLKDFSQLTQRLEQDFLITEKRALVDAELAILQNLIESYTPLYAPGGSSARVTTNCLLRATTFPVKPYSKLRVRYDMTWASRLEDVHNYDCFFWFYISENLEQLVLDMQNANLTFVHSAEPIYFASFDQCPTPPTAPPVTASPTITPRPIEDPPTSSPTVHPSYEPTPSPTVKKIPRTPTDEPSPAPSSNLPMRSQAAYEQDFDISEARKLNKTEQLIFQDLILSYTSSYVEAPRKVATTCEIWTQTILGSAAAGNFTGYRRKMLLSVSNAHQSRPGLSPRVLQDLKLRIIYELSWSSRYTNTTAIGRGFATFINENTNKMALDMRAAGLSLVQDADFVLLTSLDHSIDDAAAPSRSPSAFPSLGGTVVTQSPTSVSIDTDEGLKSGSIAAIVVGTVTFIIVGLWVYIYRYRRGAEKLPYLTAPEKRDPSRKDESNQSDRSISGKDDDGSNSVVRSVKDVDETMDVSADGITSVNLEETPSSNAIMVSSPAEGQEAVARKGRGTIHDAIRPEATAMLRPFSPYASRAKHMKHMSMPDAFVSPLEPIAFSGIAEFAGGVHPLKKNDVESGREVMRKAINSPDLDPLPISLMYLKQCTDSFSSDRRIGEGSFSQVFLGKDMVLRRKFAVKLFRMKAFVDIDAEKAKKNIEREIQTLKIFRHPNIARLYAYSLSPRLLGRHCLVFELASKGDLHDFLKHRARREKLHWTTRISIALDVSKALEYLHRGVGGQICYHRDVKSSNICLKRDFTALLIDCGVSKMIPDDESKATMSFMESTENGVRGTPGYICPVFAHRMSGYESANDVFSLGMVFAELFTGILQRSRHDGKVIDHYNRYSMHDINKRDLEKDADRMAGNWDSSARKEFSQLIIECISHDLGDRPRIEDIVHRLGNIASRSRPLSPGERNRITVLFSAPLAYRDSSGSLCPLDSLNFRLERDLLVQCMSEAGRCIEMNFDVATDDRLQAAVTRRSGCLHFSGHGHTSCLVFEDSTGGAHLMGEDKLRDCVHAEPFKFVFVSACDSLFMGRALVKAGVPHVLCCEHGMTLRDSAAIKFTHAFYYALAEGYTIKDAYETGKLAVSKRFDPSEVDNFVLLPEDGDHDESLFDAEKVAWIDESSTTSSIPLPPVYFLGRELEMYNLLQLILSQPLVTVVGDEGVGCSALASAICHYISERKTTMLEIENIYFTRGELKSSNESTFATQIKALHEELIAEGKAGLLEDGDDLIPFISGVVDALPPRSLVVLDGADTKDENLTRFVNLLFEATNSVKLLITSLEPMNPSPCCPVEEYPFFVGPLSREDTADLFVKVQNLVHPDKAPTNTAMMKRKVEESTSLFNAIGGGIPARTIVAAKELSEKARNNLFST